MDITISLIFEMFSYMGYATAHVLYVYIRNNFFFLNWYRNLNSDFLLSLRWADPQFNAYSKQYSLASDMSKRPQESR